MLDVSANHTQCARLKPEGGLEHSRTTAGMHGVETHLLTRICPRVTHPTGSIVLGDWRRLLQVGT